jgi:ABC-type multidrug transport system fused ATPase/permease subunit
MYIFKILNSFVYKYKITLFIYILFTILSFPLEAIVVPQIYSHFFEILNSKTEINVFIKYLIMITIVLIIIYSSNAITVYIESFMIPNMSEYIINYIFKNLLKKYENNFNDIELGKIITHLSAIPGALKDGASELCVWVLPRFLTIIIINIYFFYLNWKLGCISLILITIFFYVNFKLFFSCSKSSVERHHLFEIKNQDTQDKLSNTFSIYSTGSVQNEIENYELNTEKYTSKSKDSLFCLTTSNIFSNIVIIIIFITLNSMSTYLFLNKQLSYTNLIAILITIIYYIPCVLTINSSMPTIIQCYGALNAIDDFAKDLFNVSNIKTDHKQESLINNGNIVINNLNFSYNKDTKLFHNFYLTIKNGEKIAIIGPSGNGKSSLIKIIMGYYTVPNNVIFIDNKDINSYNLNDLRKQISYVNQNSKLFNKTVLENIQYGNNVSKNDIINLCKKINIDNIFKNLKDGLDTNVGVDGNNLSGGQRQLVHILRCICQKNKIVILDEPTSAIDKDNTKNIFNIINELSKNNTLILITHDESILSLVNRVIKLDSGKIISDKYN